MLSDLFTYLFIFNGFCVPKYKLMCSSVLSNTIVTRHIWLVTHKLIKIKFPSSPVSLPELNSHMWFMPTELESDDEKHFHHHRELYWTALSLIIYNFLLLSLYPS